MQVRRRVAKLKGYIYCFGNIILLLKYVQGEKGVQKFGLFKFTYFMDIIKQRFSRSTNNIKNPGKQFLTCKYKKYKLLPATTGKLFESYGYWWEEGTYFYLKFLYVHSTSSSIIGKYMDSNSYNNCDFNSQELTMLRH